MIPRGAAYVCRLRRALFLKPSDFWVMLAAYFDESGTHPKSDLLVLAGMVSPVRQWELLGSAWQRLLFKNGIEDEGYRAASCAAFQDQFKGWDAPKRLAFHQKAITLIKQRVLWRTWCVISIPDYKTFFAPENHEAARRMAYSVAFFACVSRIRDLTIERGQSEKVAYFCEAGGFGGGFARVAFEDAMREPRFDHIGSFSFGRRQDLPLLQVADLHAYEVYKNFSDDLNAHQRAKRKTFTELLEIPEAGGGGAIIGIEEFESIVKSFKDGTRRANFPIVPLNKNVQTRMKRVSDITAI
jgi:hypothetical protein